MVRTWNREPSPDQSKATRDATTRTSPNVGFAINARFAFDGKPRVSNFLNGLDGQLNEARASIGPANTCTHTRYDFSGTGTGNIAISMAAEMARSLNACSAIRSGRPKSATARSLVANDTRYAHLAEPHADHVGPGAYAVERALPSVGQMAADSHTSSATPQRDPYRANAPFLAPERPGTAQWILPSGPDSVYISPEFVPGPDHAPSWNLSTDQRPDATEWRLGHARVVAAVVAGAATGGGAGAGVSAPEAPFSSDLPTDVASRPLELAMRAALRNPHGVSFTSKEPRLTALPPERSSDMRPARVAAARGPDETAHLGPGAYTPPTSIGGARRRTYRIFVDPRLNPQPSDRFSGSSAQSEAAAVVAAREHGTARAAATARASAGAAGGCTGIGAGGGGAARRPSARSAGPGSSAGSIGSLAAGRGPATGPSAVFSAPFRDQKAGAFDWRTDSRLVRH